MSITFCCPLSFINHREIVSRMVTLHQWKCYAFKRVCYISNHFSFLFEKLENIKLLILYHDYFFLKLPNSRGWKGEFCVFNLKIKIEIIGKERSVQVSLKLVCPFKSIILRFLIGYFSYESIILDFMCQKFSWNKIWMNFWPSTSLPMFNLFCSTFFHLSIFYVLLPHSTFP